MMFELDRPSFGRMFVDGLILVLFLGMLVLPVSVIGLSGYNNAANYGGNVEVLGTQSEFETTVEVKKVNVRIIPVGQTTQSTSSTRLYEDF